MITIDTLRADHTTLGGYERDTTPALAEWARGGTVFDRAFSASSWTLPSMSMLLTGQVQVNNEGRIFPKQAPLAETLRARGYRTGAIVANPLLTSERGFDRGFDHYEVETDAPHGPTDWLAPGVTRRGIEFMSKGREPFFLLLHYFDPHDPYLPIDGLAFEPFHSAERAQAFRRALPPDQRDLLTPEVVRGIEARIAQYDSEVLQTDRGLEELFDWMDAEGLTENTIVVVTADHGEGLWQRAATVGEKPKEVFFPELYFEHGIQLYGEQVHVPLVFRGPGVPVGIRAETAVSLLDVAPTVLALLDLPRPRLMPGVALLPEVPASRGLPVYSICSRCRSVTVDGRWRLHQPRKYKLEQGARPELFDLEADPLELAPLDDPDREAELRGLIESWLAGNRAIDWGDAGPVDYDKVREEMSAIGYAVEEMMGEDYGKAPASSGADE
jgi:arylsulfatase A-like enzyme